MVVFNILQSTETKKYTAILEYGLLVSRRFTYNNYCYYIILFLSFCNFECSRDLPVIFILAKMELADTITIIGRTISQPFLFLTFLYYWHETQFRYLYRMCFMNYLASLMISNFWNIWAISNGYHKERPMHICKYNNCVWKSSIN